jgi:SynChlorMet cassette protein ScmD
MKLTDKPVANPFVVLREEFDDWAVLFNPDTADAVGINPIGVAVWKQMDGIRTVGQLIDQVRLTYQGVPDTVETEITSFLDDLVTKGFVGLETAQTS